MRRFSLLIALAALAGPLLAPSGATADDSPTESLLRQAQQAAGAGESQRAIALLTEAIQQNPQLADAYYLRGRERFRLGQVEGSVEDFDELLRLRPQRRASFWERGISLYYAKKPEEGARQFSLYQTFDNNDVENAVWRFLCVARTSGLEKARRELLPIERDPRVPMMEIYELYRGQATADDVVAAAGRAAGNEQAARRQLFYAHLYIGLHEEALGNAEKAREHLRKAAGEYRIGHYMGDVARIHVQLRWGGK